MTSWSHDPRKIRRKMSGNFDTFDHAESQSVDKTNIRQKVAWSEHMFCLFSAMQKNIFIKKIVIQFFWEKISPLVV